MEGSRDITFDIAKGIGIILVVMGHYIPPGAPGWYVCVANWVYHFHMPLFFLIGGYFYARSIREISYGALLRRKFERLMVPYFALSIAIIIVKILSENLLQVDHPVSWAALYRMFYLPEAGFFLWFVYALFLMFCIVPWFKPGRRMYVLFALSLGAALIPDVTPLFCLQQVCLYLVFFTAGMCFSRCDFKRICRLVPLWILATLLLSVAYGFLTAGVWLRLLDVAVGVSGSLMILGLSMLLARKSSSANALLSYVGSMSMTVYLFHTMFMGAAKPIVLHILSVDNTIEFIFSALFTIGIGVLAPIGLYRWILARNKWTARIFK